jgi:YVTN family beta-propeller protein
MLLAASTLVSCGSSEPELRTIDVEHPSAVAVGGGSVWVADDVDHVVRVFEADTGAPVGRAIDVKKNPIAIAVHDDDVWVAHASGWITRLDVQTRRADDPIESGFSFTSVTVRDGLVWATDVERGLVRVDPDNEESVMVRPMKDGAVRAIAVGEDLWITGREDTVTKLDVRSRRSRTFEVGNGPIGLASVGERIYVANSDDDTVTVLDARSGENLQTLDVGDAPVAIATSKLGVFVANQDDASVSRIEDGAVTATIDVETHPRGIAAADDAVWVVGTNPGALVRVDL